MVLADVLEADPANRRVETDMRLNESDFCLNPIEINDRLVMCNLCHIDVGGALPAFPFFRFKLKFLRSATVGSATT